MPCALGKKLRTDLQTKHSPVKSQHLCASGVTTSGLTMATAGRDTGPDFEFGRDGRHKTVRLLRRVAWRVTHGNFDSKKNLVGLGLVSRVAVAESEAE
jgi:hypothetical protein